MCPPDESVDCLMSSSMGKAVWRFSNCSQLVLDSFNGNCLNNQPKSLYGDPVCGNGFVEEGEECDCGTEEVGVLEFCWMLIGFNDHSYLRNASNLILKICHSNWVSDLPIQFPSTFNYSYHLTHRCPMSIVPFRSVLLVTLVANQSGVS